MLEHIMSMIIPVILILLVLAVLASNIRVVPQSRAFVIERLGAFQGVWGVGLHFKIPFIERVAKNISLKEHGVRIFCSIWNISVTRKYSMPCMPQSIIM